VGTPPKGSSARPESTAQGQEHRTDGASPRSRVLSSFEEGLDPRKLVVTGIVRHEGEGPKITLRTLNCLNGRQEDGGVEATADIDPKLVRRI